MLFNLFLIIPNCILGGKLIPQAGIWKKKIGVHFFFVFWDDGRSRSDPVVVPFVIQILNALGRLTHDRVCCSGCRVAKGLGRFNGNMPRSSMAPGP